MFVGTNYYLYDMNKTGVKRLLEDPMSIQGQKSNFLDLNCGKTFACQKKIILDYYQNTGYIEINCIPNNMLVHQL